MIKRSTLRAQLAGALRDEILAGRLPAGSHFTVKEIAEQYGVSATPVREALVDLAAQGLLDVEQHRGFRVHEFTVDDYRSMVKARMAVLDGLFHSYFTADGPVPMLTLDDAVLASVRRRAEAAVRAARAGDLDVLIGYDLRYWRELGEVIGNRYISDFLDRLRVQCWVCSVPCLRSDPDLVNRLWSGHRELADALEREDMEETRRIMSDYHRHALALADKASGFGP
ncbi:GntR family transcriptional regulator [Streptomyces sp. WMMB 322]|uniref:GntR family transcriptional regulator n=1 Tax=Streptomyces sp. WMMB 322 TaxID=1286821 RepID=UPI0006E21DB7|nr:GntR family transcriptional regulator [Streptomyces sp. WMMB 322]SCK38450.1 DNA-binding transcriptional regulator, GntR family [Streptomyces sp. WMMB 322]